MNRYYVPEIEEFHVGFEFETRYLEKDWIKKKLVFDDFGFYTSTWNVDSTPETEFRVKHLDREDIESLGFTDKPFGVNTKRSFYKITGKNLLQQNKVIQITTYWDMLREKRENMVRILKGEENNFPYTEVFRGDIKNKSELKKVLNQVER